MGNKNTTTLINNTDEVMEIRVFRGIMTDKKNVIGTAKAHQRTDIDHEKFGGDDSQGGQFPSVQIFCDGRSLLKSPVEDLVWGGEELFYLETVTIDQLEDQNSTAVVNYEIKFQTRCAEDKANPLKVFSYSVLKYDNGWSVHWNNWSVKLTRAEGMTIILDPSKLFASNIVPDPETSLLNVVLKFWPRIFADLNCKDELGTTVCAVNDLMRQAKLYNVDRSKVKVANVVEKVSVLNELYARAMVAWYLPLFPGMEDQFPQGPMAEDDKVKLDKFKTTIKDMLSI